MSKGSPLHLTSPALFAARVRALVGPFVVSLHAPTASPPVHHSTASVTSIRQVNMQMLKYVTDNNT